VQKKSLGFSFGTAGYEQKMGSELVSVCPTGKPNWSAGGHTKHPGAAGMVVVVVGGVVVVVVLHCTCSQIAPLQSEPSGQSRLLLQPPNPLSAPQKFPSFVTMHLPLAHCEPPPGHGTAHVPLAVRTVPDGHAQVPLWQAPPHPPQAVPSG